MDASSLTPAVNVFATGLGKWASYAWVLIPFAIIVGLGLVVWIFKTIKKKRSQWTHTLKVRRVLHNGRLTDAIVMRMRRFPLIKKAEVFELEKPLLGGYLFPELGEYSGENEFAIILDKNNRIYTDQGSYFNPSKGYTQVSSKHSEIDIQRSNLKAKYQDINKVQARVEWTTIAKYAFFALITIAIMVVSIVSIQSWGEAQAYKAQESKSMAEAMSSLAIAMDSVEATVNTQKLEILPMLQEIYKTKNIQEVINRPVIINGS